MTRNARSLRTRSTDEERRIWLRIRHLRPRWTRQLPAGPYILDLACRTLRLAVEIDGGQHADSASDVDRTAFLERLGWQVLRFWNSDVRENPDGVVLAITEAVEIRQADPPPAPPFQGGEE